MIEPGVGVAGCGGEAEEEGAAIGLAGWLAPDVPGGAPLLGAIAGGSVFWGMVDMPIEQIPLADNTTAFYAF